MTDNPFEATLDRLRAKGWRKGAYGTNKGPNCILGGIKIAKGMNAQDLLTQSPEVDTLIPIVEGEYPDRVGSMSCIPNFNDHPDTTFDDIERVLEKAAVKWEENRVLRGGN